MDRLELQSSIDQGMSHREIADHFGLSGRGMVSYWIRKYDIESPVRSTREKRGGWSKYSDEQLTEAVANSVSVLGVLRYLGCHGSNMHRNISSRIRTLQLDNSHFRRHGFEKGTKQSSSRKTSCEIFVVLPQGSLRTPRHQLHRSMQEVGVPYECVVCGNSGEWQGQPLLLQIDHIDGDWLNNLRSNLRYLCPNCHSQQATSSSTNTRLCKSMTA